MDAIRAFEQEFLRDDQLASQGRQTGELEQMFRDPCSAQQLVLHYLRQVAQLTAELNALVSESRPAPSPGPLVPGGLGGSAARRTSIIKRLSGSQAASPLKFARSIVHKPQPLPPLHAAQSALHRRGSDGNFRARSVGKQPAHSLPPDDPKSPARQNSVRSDGAPPTPTGVLLPRPVSNAVNLSVAARPERKPSTSTMASRDSSSEQRRPLKVDGPPLPARQKTKSFTAVLGGLFSKRRAASAHGTASESPNANPNGAASRRRMPKFLLNLAARRSHRPAGNNKLSGSSSSLRKHDVARKGSDGADKSKKAFAKGATIASPGRRAYRYVEVGSYRVDFSDLNDSTSGQSACASRPSSSIDSQRVHLSQVATLQVPTLFDMGVTPCEAVSSTVESTQRCVAVSHHSQPSSPSTSRLSRRASHSARAAFEKDITDWLSRTRMRLESLLNELTTLLQTANDRHCFSPFSASTMARILAGASDEERLKQLRSEYERHFTLDRQLKFALMRQHHTILLVVALLLGRKLDTSLLFACTNKHKRANSCDRPLLRRANTLTVSNRHLLHDSAVLERTSDHLLHDAALFNDDVVRNLLKALDESNERTQVLLSSKKAHTIPSSRMLNVSRQLRSANRPQSTEMLNSSQSASPSSSSSYMGELAREHRRASRRNSGETQREFEDEKLRAALHILLRN